MTTNQLTPRPCAHRHALHALALAAIASIASPQFVTGTASAATLPAATTEQIVLFDDGADPATEVRQLESVGMTILEQYGSLRAVKVATNGKTVTNPGMITAPAATRLEVLGSPDDANLAATDSTSAEAAESADVQLAPTSSAGRQPAAPWGLDRVDQAEGMDGIYSYSAAGAGVYAYVVDTGIAQHDDLAGRIAQGADFVRDGNGWNDCHGHGTHVAGSIAGSTFGIAKEVVVVPVRALDCNGAGSTEQIVEGLDWIIANHPAGIAGVVNMSFGGGIDRLLDAAVERLVARGFVVVAAAGNSDSDACDGSPGRSTSALTVAASTRDDGRAGFSSWGECVDLFAPGQEITSAMIGSAGALATWSGTSMAAPHVTGAAALLLGAGLSAIEVIARLSATAVTNKVADPKGSLNRLLHTAPGDLSWLPQTPDRTVRIEAVTAAIGTPTAQGGRLSAQVIVRDAATGMPVPGVIVNGDWVVGPWNMGVVSALSGSRGMTMITGPFYRGSGSARFCVKSVSGAAVLVADQELTCASTSNLPPVAVIEADTTNGTSPLPVTFSATSSHDPDGKSLHYEWRFGDGVAHTGPRVTHTYGRPGNYTALLYVTDAYGATSKRAWTVVVAAGDQALTPVAPLRLLDTRSGTPVTPLPNQKKPVEAGETLRLELDGIAGVSIRDAAVVLNVTAVNAADTGFVTVFPCGLRPLASNLNTHAGAVVANQVIAALSPEADVCLYSSARLDLVIDITGVLRSGRGFTPVSPVRVVDSRVSETAPGRLPAATLLPGDIFEIDLAGIAGNPGGSNAAALNVTAVNAAVGGFLTVYPCGQRPLASNVNVAAGKVAANFVLASLSTDQRVCVYSSTRTDVVIDVSGWFAQHAGLVTFSPGRVLDTRIKDPGNSPYAGSVTYVDLLQDTTVIGGDTVFTDPLVAPGAASVALNVTVVAGHTAGFVTVYPCSNERPLASNVNFSPGQIVANAVVVPIHPTGVVCVYSSAAIELVVDVNGWFAA